jgi:hypothetical protein
MDLKCQNCNHELNKKVGFNGLNEKYPYSLYLECQNCGLIFIVGRLKKYDSFLNSKN